MDEDKLNEKPVPLYTEEKKPLPDEAPAEIEEVTAHDEPNMLSKKEIILLCISYFGISLTFLVLSVELVPAQIQAMVGESSKGRWLGGMVATGAVLTIITGPLIGMKSDRCSSPYGKRRPVIVLALLILSIGMCGMAFSAPDIVVKRQLNETGECEVNLTEHRCRPYVNDSTPEWKYTSLSKSPDLQAKKRKQIEYNELKKGNLGLYIFCFFLMNASFICITIPYNGLVSDKSNVQQRGLISGIMGFCILSGNICGAGIGLFFTQMGIVSAYACCLTLLTICILATVFSTPEDVTKPIKEPIDIKKIFIGFWEPLKAHDFRWVFITRFLLQQGLGTIIGFLDYWMTDMIYLPYCWAPERGVALALLPLMSMAAISSLFMGTLSDRIGRRKPLIVAACVVMACVALTFAFIRGPYAFYVTVSVAFIFGIGLGTYQAVDFALVLDVLPDEENRSRDIAVWHQAMEIPKALATPVAGIIIDVFESINCEIGLGYIMLFLITSSYFFLSGIFMFKIRGVK